MEATATSSPSSFKLALVSCLIFLGLLACCSGQMKNKDFNISCQSSYVKDTLGTVTCAMDLGIFESQCSPQPGLLQFYMGSSNLPKCDVLYFTKFDNCLGREPADGVVDCVGEFPHKINYSCHFIATSTFKGKSAQCVVHCKNASTGVKYGTLVTEKCHLKFGKSPKGPSTRRPKKKPQQVKKFPLMALLIACAIAGVIVLVACLTWRNCHEVERDSVPNAEGTELQTDASGWTETTTATTELTEQPTTISGMTE
ncbi:uncharacterized protein LOC112575835 isoform X2 [Pomacea canaliculata]|uniref:uncharacterized protein LOC112575835 isoform X2 n=1 Tax=Pomacea canaliculata TaxID=400727 RepID=UPI000D732650|nr:uncharacterized protein LOC112575835 isoform X2 [Pomacea canaliculata]